MSSITSMFTFSQFISLKGPLLKTQWSRRGRGRIGSLPPGSSEKLPVCYRHSPIFWFSGTLLHSGWELSFVELQPGQKFLEGTTPCAPDFLSFKWKTQPSMISRCSVSSICGGFISFYFFFVIERCNLLFWVTCFPSTCLVFFYFG